MLTDGTKLCRYGSNAELEGDGYDVGNDSEGIAGGAELEKLTSSPLTVMVCFLTGK